jgi:hypothetical protein
LTDTGGKTRKRRSAKRRTLTEEEYSKFKAIESYLSQPERFRRLYPPLELISSQSDVKRPPGIPISDPTKTSIENYVFFHPEFAERIDGCLKKIKGNLSVKDPKIKKLRQEIIDTVPSLKKIDKTKIREWLRDRHKRLKRRKKR